MCVARLVRVGCKQTTRLSGGCLHLGLHLGCLRRRPRRRNSPCDTSTRAQPRRFQCPLAGCSDSTRAGAVWGFSSTAAASCCTLDARLMCARTKQPEKNPHNALASLSSSSHPIHPRILPAIAKGLPIVAPRTSVPSLHHHCVATASSTLQRQARPSCCCLPTRIHSIADRTPSTSLSTQPANRPRPRRLLRQLRSSHTRPRTTPLPLAHQAPGLAWSARTRTSIAEVELGARREADDDIGPAHLHLVPHQHSTHSYRAPTNTANTTALSLSIQDYKQPPDAPATHFVPAPTAHRHR